VQTIPFQNYTHIVHFGARPRADCTLRVNGPDSLVDNSDADALVGAAHAAGRKALLSIAGGPPGTFSRCTGAAEAPAFAAAIVKFVDRHGYDGVDLDWEDAPIGPQFNNFIEALHRTRPQWTLTLDVSRNPQLVLPALNPNVQQVNLMCYDRDWGTTKTRFNSLLVSNPEADRPGCDADLQWFVDQGVPAGRLGIGLPFYARKYSPATGPWQSGFYRSPFGDRATLFFNQLVDDPVRWQSKNRRWDDKVQGQYLVVDPGPTGRPEFIAYTGPEQIRAAVGLMRAGRYGGIMVFSLEYEYLYKRMGAERYPLTSALSAALGATESPAPANSQRREAARQTR
jgi:GH18 family chitinase